MRYSVARYIRPCLRTDRSTIARKGIFCLGASTTVIVLKLDEAGGNSAAKKEEIVSFDGRDELRRSSGTVRNKSAIHMVSAWATNARLVLGQVKVDEKSNEITAIPELLDLLDVAGCLVTIDAMGCQKAIAKKIHEKKGNYILALKRNHPGFCSDIELFLEHAKADKFEGLVTRTRTTVEKDHGRIETREFLLVDLPDGIAWSDEKCRMARVDERWSSDCYTAGCQRTRSAVGNTVIHHEHLRSTKAASHTLRKRSTKSLGN